MSLTFAEKDAYGRIEEGDTLEIVGETAFQVRNGSERVTVSVNDDWTFDAKLNLTTAERETLAAGGKLSRLKRDS